MPTVHATATKFVNAPPSKVYKVLAEPKHHKHILPPQFLDYEEESENLVRFKLKVGGKMRHYRMRVELTDPDRLMTEIDVETSIPIQFILTPQDAGTVVTISMKYDSPGINGMIESFAVPMLLQPLYRRELELLAEYAPNVTL